MRNHLSTSRKYRWDKFTPIYKTRFRATDDIPRARKDWDFPPHAVGDFTGDNPRRPRTQLNPKMLTLPLTATIQVVLVNVDRRRSLQEPVYFKLVANCSNVQGSRWWRPTYTVNV